MTRRTVLGGLLMAPSVLAARLHFPTPGQGMDGQRQRTVDEAGLNPKVIADLHGQATRWALWRDGNLLHVDGDLTALGEVASLRKTWHAMAVGAALQQGRIPSLDQKLRVWNPELQGKDADATWRHVLTQSTGFDYPYGDQPAYKPGEMWTYSDRNLVHLCNALAHVYGKRDYTDHYRDVLAQAYFDAIGMRGWDARAQNDGVRLVLSLENMGRLGLLTLARGNWNGKQLVPRTFVEQLESKQTRGMKVNYDGPNDGKIPYSPTEFPEAPYGFLTWANTDGDLYPGADRRWACGRGRGGYHVLWNHRFGIVYAGVGVNQTGPRTEGIAQRIERNLRRR